MKENSCILSQNLKISQDQLIPPQPMNLNKTILVQQDKPPRNQWENVQKETFDYNLKQPQQDLKGQIYLKMQGTDSRNQRKKISFKESFAESENFCNIEEKLEEEKIYSCRNVLCSSLNSIIKQRFLGPNMQGDIGSTSFLKRNILQT